MNSMLLVISIFPMIFDIIIITKIERKYETQSQDSYLHIWKELSSTNPIFYLN